MNIDVYYEAQWVTNDVNCTLWSSSPVYVSLGIPLTVEAGSVFLLLSCII